jgi:uncharacterized integral membrane protein
MANDVHEMTSSQSEPEGPLRTMRYVSWIATIIFVLVVVAFSIMNGEERTTVWPMPWSAPVYIIIFVTFFVGFVLGGIVTWFSGGRRRQRARQATERAKALARQLADLQRQHAVGTAATLGDSGNRLQAS